MAFGENNGRESTAWLFIRRVLSSLYYLIAIREPERKRSVESNHVTGVPVCRCQVLLEHCTHVTHLIQSRKDISITLFCSRIEKRLRNLLRCMEPGRRRLGLGPRQPNAGGHTADCYAVLPSAHADGTEETPWAHSTRRLSFLSAAYVQLSATLFLQL